MRSSISAVTGRFWSSETAVMATLALIVGLGAGLGTIVFVRMITFFTDLFFGSGKAIPLPLGTYVILLPVLGGLIVGPIIHFVAPEAKGHGVPEVLTAIATKGGRIRPVVVLAKALGSAITIGSGGSVGREGPIVQIGAALGSTLGQFFKLNERRVVNLVASGAAGGIAATFNAPIAGVMFAIEVILGGFELSNLSTLVISAVTASVVSRAALGSSPAFSVPSYTLASPWELPLYLGLGIVGALGAILFIKMLYFLEDIFDNWKFPPYLKPAIGGLGLGIVGYLVPQAFGTGFNTIGDALAGKLTLGLLLILALGKLLATTLTLGSGASGGVFAPALFMGAVIGGAYGQVMHLILPGVTGPSGAYAVVGMAAVFAGAARAPITAIVIMFEMTQDYQIILPLMFATVVSSIIAQHLEPESIYTLKLKLRGIDMRARKQDNPLREVYVKDAMTPIGDLDTVNPDMSVVELAQMFQQTGHHGFIVQKDRELVGVVTVSDLERALANKNTSGRVNDICTKNVITIYPDETLDDALRHFGVFDVGRIPVVERRHPHCVVGVLRRTDIVHSLSSTLVNKQQRAQRLTKMQFESRIGSELVELDVAPSDCANGKSLREINLPDDCVIVSIQRGSRVVVPRGHTELETGDRIIALVSDGKIDELKRAICDGNPAPPEK
jgi:CIC family chloride channel protein